jgi:hypothetical protein
MKQKAANELVWLQPHDLLGAILTIILPGEGDVIVVEHFDAVVGDGDAMGVAAEIGENLGGPAERLLGVETTQSMRRMAWTRAVKASPSARCVRPLKNPSIPATKVACRRSRNRRRNSRESGLMARKKFGRFVTHRVPSHERPPPGTTQWTCG